MTQLFEWDYSGYPGAKKYPNVFKPITIGKLTIPNRVKYAATEDNLNSHDGFVTDEDVAYIQARAKGVAGGICTIQGVYMDERAYGQGYVGQAAAWDDKFVPGLKRLADAIHEERSVANYQLMHCGRVGGVKTPVCEGPSAVPQRLRHFKPVHVMNKQEIQESIDQHRAATVRGLEAGFDIIEISGIVGYLLSNFISSYTNRRTDEYGGDLRGRMKLATDIIKACREEMGPDIPLIIRICAWELLDDVGGNTKEESLRTYEIAEEACVACNVCLARLFRDAPMTCYINPTCAHENDPSFYPQKAEEEKEVMIVGAGPAGLECAWVAAERGQEVHVYDSREEVGGTLLDAKLSPYNDDELYGHVDFAKTLSDKYGVEFHLGQEVTPELIEEELPDTVVLATGAKYAKGEGEGWDRDSVISLPEALYGTKEIGENVVVYGVHKPAIGCALALAQKGHKVTMIGPERRIGKDINPSFRWRYRIFLRENGVIPYNDCDIESIEDGRVIGITYDGHRIPIKADTVVYAEREADAPLKDVVKREAIELHVIGDALVPRGHSGAVHDGYRTGLRI